MRGKIPKHCPVHVTVRVRRGLPGLRRGRLVRAFRRSLAACCLRDGFRIVHHSVQRNDIHLLIEAQGKVALGRGMKSLSARIGRCVNRMFDRSGKVLDGRYHHRVLVTPREVRHALSYVLLNSRHHHHGRPPPQVRLDPASSAIWLEGWKQRPPPIGAHSSRQASAPLTPRCAHEEVAGARTWLLTRGWRRHRLIDPAEVPGSAR